MNPVQWSILIATLAERRGLLARLLRTLLPQVEAGHGVEVVALYNNGELPLQHIRQALLEDARGEWVSFVDDDDLVDPDYVAAISACFALNPDYVAFNHRLYWPEGQGWREDPKPALTGLHWKGWYDSPEGYIRDVTHINPARTSLARQAGFLRLVNGQEDQGYVTALRPLLKTQARIGRVLYYYYPSGVNPMVRKDRGEALPRLEIGSPAFRWHHWSTGG